MVDRVADKTAIVVGAGQTEGHGVGNGRATAIVLAREGAKVLVVDRDLRSAQETVDMIVGEGGQAVAAQADVTNETDHESVASRCLELWDRIDILHYNVGIGGTISGDAPVTDIDMSNFGRIMAINLQGMVLASKYVIPAMRSQGSGVITNISSNAVLINYPDVAYKTSKAGAVALTQQIAITNAAYGIRANVILPGLMNTPMAVEQRVSGGASRAQVADDRNSRVPLRNKQGSAWDVANAALYLASDEADFVTGATLVVDGGQSLLVG